jgi:hypothetical protein
VSEGQIRPSRGRVGRRGEDRRLGTRKTIRILYLTWQKGMINEPLAMKMAPIASATRLVTIHQPLASVDNDDRVVRVLGRLM